jgi:hypothetical protein
MPLRGSSLIARMRTIKSSRASSCLELSVRILKVCVCLYVFVHAMVFFTHRMRVHERTGPTQTGKGSMV